MLSYVNVNCHVLVSISFNFPLSDEGYQISKSNCLPWDDNNSFIHQCITNDFIAVLITYT